MIRLLSPLAVWLLLTTLAAAQALDHDDPFRVLHAKAITVTTHLSDGRMRDQEGVRFIIDSDWEHSEADRAAFVEMIIANPKKFTNDTGIVKLMLGANILLVADFYKTTQSGVVQKLLYFKDSQRRGWERLELAQKTD